MHFQSLIVIAASVSQTYAHSDRYKYIAVFSIDGLHGSDVEKYIGKRNGSTIAALLKTGYEYTHAYTAAPADSFPGILNQFTGASPKTTGVWYDVSFDRTFYPPFSESKTNCSGTPGAEVAYDESKDYNSTELFSGGIDPQNLPQTILKGKCTYVYPHQRLRANTVFEVAHEAGLETAYADKHPAYDIVRGPSGEGLSVGYFPEIAAVGSSVDANIAYDKLHVDAFLQWIDGKTPEHSEIQKALTGTPKLFGGNFQAVSVAQKVAGYQAKTLDFTPDLLKALDFVDESLGKVVAALKSKKIYEDTLIIIASKHGQAPINPAKLNKINPDIITNAVTVPTLGIVTDDVALIFLLNHNDTATAVADLRKNTTGLGISDIIYGHNLISQGFGNPATDPAVPDIIVRPVEGVIYTTGTKVAEHGGLNEDDLHVACFVSNPKLKAKKFCNRVSTRQVAPTILTALDLDVGRLEGAELEGTRVLDGFGEGEMEWIW